MDISTVSPQRKSLAEKLQYERVAVLEAVLTLRDKRLQTRMNAIYWTIAAAVASGAVVAVWL